MVQKLDVLPRCTKCGCDAAMQTTWNMSKDGTCEKQYRTYCSWPDKNDADCHISKKKSYLGIECGFYFECIGAHCGIDCNRFYNPKFILGKDSTYWSDNGNALPVDPGFRDATWD